jgi:alpha-N-arabinofuranosidase
MNKATLKAGLIICLMFAGVGAVAQNGFSVDKTAVPKTYDPMIFGQFIEHFHRQIYGGIFEPGSPLADADGFRRDVVEALLELKIPIIRWPGGCFVSSYHWLDGVGPNRQPALDKAWDVEDPNTFGTAEFVKWCKLINAEPYICTNAGTGTPEEMSDWVEYCNRNIGKYGRMRKSHGADEPFNVKYWSIGNENYMWGEIGHKTNEEWVRLVVESAKMMHAVDPDIKLFAASWPDEKWVEPILKETRNLIDYISIHGYYGGQNSSYLDIISATHAPADAIQRTISGIEEAGKRGKTKIAFDEWNPRGWHHPNYPAGNAAVPSAAKRDELIKERENNELNSIYTMADAVFSACFLNTCLRFCDDVPIAGFSPVVNTRGALFVHPKGVVRRTTFHVLSMYANMLEKNFLPSEVQSDSLKHGDRSVATLDIAVTCNDEKTRFAIAAVNKHPDKAVAFAPDFAALAGATPKQVQAVVLSGSSADDFNDVGNENRVVPTEKTLKVDKGLVTLPPHSVVIIQLRK